MKKNKAFTLIELLATIVIIAIVAVITVPIILGVLDDAKKSAFKDTAYGIIDAANLYYSLETLKGNTLTLTTFTVSNNKLVSGDKELVFTGKVPVGDSWVKINEEGRVSLRITDGKYYVSKDYDEIGVVLAESEEEALTREELARELAELRNIVNNNTTAINNNNTAANMFLKVYPVGSIYITTDSTNPSETYGGTWEIYGSGRTLVGVDTTQAEFNTVNKTGGEKTHILTIDEIPIHNHTFTTSSTSKSLKGSLYLQALGVSPISDSIIASASGVFTRYNTNGSGEYVSAYNIAQSSTLYNNIYVEKNCLIYTKLVLIKY